MWNDKWGEKPWQYDDKYLVSLANELNSKCEKQKELKQAKKNNIDLEEIRNLASIIQEWDPDELDYEFAKCRDYCYGGYNYRWDNKCYELCINCKKLLDKKIRKPFNKTPREIGQEFQILNDRIEELENRIKELIDKMDKIDKIF